MPVSTCWPVHTSCTCFSVVLKVLKAKSPGEKMMEHELKSNSVMFGFTVQRYSRSLTTSVSQALKRYKCMCVYTVCTAKREW